jgi:transposase-like protein
MGMSMWREFVAFAEKGDEPFTAICARFGVSRKTGYKWLNRFRTEGEAGLVEQSRRPKTSPRKTPESVADLVLSLRRENPEWSAARISAELKEQGVAPLPAPSTIDLILRRRREAASLQAPPLGRHPDTLRFEPNYRWVLCLGRELKLAGGAARIPAFVRDETTNFIVGTVLLTSARQEEELTEFLGQLFQRHGLPWRMALPAPRTHTLMSVWLMRVGLGIDFVPAGPAAVESDRQQLAARLAALPSYQRGALEERLHRADLLHPLYELRAISESQAKVLLEQIRAQQNFGGKQEALQQRSPLSLYRPSARVMPEKLPEVAYAPEAEVRLVSEKGIFTFQRRLVHVGRAFAGHEVELKPTPLAGHYFVLFAGQVLGQVDLSAAERDETTSLPLHAV